MLGGSDSHDECGIKEDFHHRCCVGTRKRSGHTMQILFVRQIGKLYRQYKTAKSILLYTRLIAHGFELENKRDHII